MRLEALIGGGTNSLALLQLLAELIATLLPQMEKLGVTTAADVEVETLVERMHNEVLATSSVILPLSNWRMVLCVVPSGVAC
jgi:hypothetical protein